MQLNAATRIMAAEKEALQKEYDELCEEMDKAIDEGHSPSRQDYKRREELRKKLESPKLTAAKGPNLPAFKAALVTLCKTYWPSIPMQKIAVEGEKAGIALLDEDGSLWEGVLTGREGRCSIDLGDVRSNIKINKQLHLQWHKMESGRYEINCYTD